jgi:catechol 2,3-dioxygenase-like lactoylglutathione lyase family enzyme
MLSYVTIGTNDFDKALTFYDSLISKLNGSRAFATPTAQFYGFGEGALFGVLKPENGKAATSGNGTMFAFKADSHEAVNELHAHALELGATDEGAPGPRGDQGFYAGYFRDLDGNKLCVYLM